MSGQRNLIVLGKFCDLYIYDTFFVWLQAPARTSVRLAIGPTRVLTDTLPRRPVGLAWLLTELGASASHVHRRNKKSVTGLSEIVL